MPSTAIRNFDYHAQHFALDVEFVTGRRYRYAGVPPQVVHAFRDARSKGTFFNTHIRDRYAFSELAPAERRRA